MTKLLVIETALRGAALAFAEWDETSPTKIRAQAYFTEAHAATAAMHQLWEQIQQDSGWTLNDLDAVVVDRGPGSFTGVKVGIAFAQALRFGMGDQLPCMGLIGIVARANSEPGHLFILPANRSQGFFALKKEGEAQTLLGLLQLDGGIRYFTVERESLAPSMVSASRRILLQGWPEFEKICKEEGSSLTTDDSETVLRHAIRHLIEESRRRIHSQGGILNDSIEPLYISYSAPEEKLLAQKAKETQWPKK